MDGGPTQLTIFTEGATLQGQLIPVSEYLQKVKNTVVDRCPGQADTAWSRSLRHNAEKARAFEEEGSLLDGAAFLHLYGAGLITANGGLLSLPQDMPISVTASKITGWAPGLLVTAA